MFRYPWQCWNIVLQDTGEEYAREEEENLRRQQKLYRFVWYCLKKLPKSWSQIAVDLHICLTVWKHCLHCWFWLPVQFAQLLKFYRLLKPDRFLILVGKKLPKFFRLNRFVLLKNIFLQFFRLPLHIPVFLMTMYLYYRTKDFYNFYQFEIVTICYQSNKFILIWWQGFGDLTQTYKLHKLSFHSYEMSVSPVQCSCS